jgi:hypothetical protein
MVSFVLSSKLLFAHSSKLSFALSSKLSQIFPQKSARRQSHQASHSKIKQTKMKESRKERGRSSFIFLFTFP